jgi:hypothetical protein
MREETFTARPPTEVPQHAVGVGSFVLCRAVDRVAPNTSSDNRFLIMFPLVRRGFNQLRYLEPSGREVYQRVLVCH